MLPYGPLFLLPHSDTPSDPLSGPEPTGQPRLPLRTAPLHLGDVDPSPIWVQPIPLLDCIRAALGLGGGEGKERLQGAGRFHAAATVQQRARDEKAGDPRC